MMRRSSLSSSAMGRSYLERLRVMRRILVLNQRIVLLDAILNACRADRADAQATDGLHQRLAREPHTHKRHNIDGGCRLQPAPQQCRLRIALMLAPRPAGGIGLARQLKQLATLGAAQGIE